MDYEDGEKWSKVPFRFAELKGLLNDWALGMQAGGGWNALFWNNHDQPRALNRFGDVQRYRAESATMLATVIHLLRGTPYIYQGEEIGMIDPVDSRLTTTWMLRLITLLRPCVRGGSRRARRLRLCAPRHGIIRVFPCNGSLVPVRVVERLVLVPPSPWLAPAPSVDAAPARVFRWWMRT